MMSIPSPPHLGSSSSIHETGSDIDSPLHIDLHQDLFPDYYGGPTPIRSVPPKEEYLRNDIPNGNNLTDIPNGINDATPMIKENDFPAPPVPPCAAGEGLPYAPIDWPNPGDIWSWRVGKRVNNAGFHTDRFLNVPKCLRFPGSPKQFASKLALERFLLSHFPNADMNVFFASFSWKVPAVLESPTRITSVPKEDFLRNDTPAVLESPTPITSVPKIDFPRNDTPAVLESPTPITSVSKEDFPRNDIPNGNNLNDIPNGINDSPPTIKENDFTAPLVSPCTAGEGLPYAPIDWPNPGDIWCWRVGKRVNNAGFYSDRFLNVPKCLRFPGSPKQFASKPKLERFLLSHFPNADMNAFFASFSWNVPAVLESPTPITSVPNEDFPRNDIPNEINDSPSMIKENDFPAPPVPPCTAGEGLPYAPIDWPNPGDIWCWRVGKRVNNAGFHSDRFLNVPKCLRFPGSPKQFASKLALERFLLSHLPNADMNAFFASFSWNVPAVLDSPTPVTSVMKEDFPRNDIPNGNNLNDIPNGINDAAPTIKENDFLAPPVPPCTTGEGLPYAPIDWPNPGDIWSWRVGKRVNNAGFYSDRFLNVPKCLRFPGSQKMFASKLTLERFLLSHFPNADMDTFFASFSWNIPAVLESPIKAEPAVGIEDAKNESNTEDAKNKSNKKTPRGSQRKRNPPPRTPVFESSHKKQKLTKGLASATPKRQTRQRVTNSAPPPPPPPPETEDTNGGLELAFLDDETTKAEFDSYINALDELLVQPLSEESISHPVLYNYFAAENEMAEARMKLSSFLDMDFPSLICFKDLDELTSLASKLRKDPSLTAEQLVKLKLIEEIPSFCDVFLENREVMEQADKFFTTLEVNRAKVTSLRQEYRELREQVTRIQSEVDSNTSTVQEIDNHIAQLKSRRAQLTRLIENRKKDKEELTHNQKLVVNSIPKVVHEVQLANAKKPEWELKKENAERREAEILSKFAPLKGFSL